MIKLNIISICLFIVFTALLYQLPDKKNRWIPILITSLLFYTMLIGEKVLLILILSYLIYLSSFLKEKTWLFTFFFISILIPLIISKYFNQGGHFEGYFKSYHLLLSDFSVIDIIGLSYFTFNGLSYLIDIKRNYIKVEKNFFLVLLYLVYFPAIFSGPLHRAEYLFNAFKNIEITKESISNGFRLILWGLFKNLVIAQRVFFMISDLKNSDLNGLYYIVVGFLFFIYLYCNFSSFIDFFQGVSQIFNIRMKDNFKNRIYLASSRHEFWRGWHITLNEWFRDYFFFVLVKLTKKKIAINLILLLTFLMIALWHELSIVLLIWGIGNGLWIIGEKSLKPLIYIRLNWKKYLGILYHIFFSSILAMVFISNDVLSLYENLAGPAQFPESFLAKNFKNLLIFFGTFLVMDFHYRKAKDLRFDDYLSGQSLLYRWFVYIKLSFLIIAFGFSVSINNYYIQF